MAVPYDLYVRFLATKGFDDLARVNEHLGDLNLSPVDQKTLDAHWAVIQSVTPAGIQAQIDSGLYGGDFLRWMQVLEVKDLWHGERAFQTAELRPVVKLTSDIHQDLALRTCINALLIKGCPHKDIAQTVGVKFSTLLKENHIGLYERFFFNPRRMSRTNWKKYISGCNEREASVYFTALTEPLDTLKTELELPAKISVSDSLQWLLSKSVLKAKQFMNVGTPEANREAREWIEQVVKLTDKYEKYRSGDREDFANALQMEFEFVDSDFGSPDDDVIKERTEKLKVPDDSKTPVTTGT